MSSQLDALIPNESSSRQHQDVQAPGENGARFQALAPQSQKRFFSFQPEQASGN